MVLSSSRKLNLFNFTGIKGVVRQLGQERGFFKADKQGEQKTATSQLEH
jgi:hypothetical protein